MVNQNRAHFSWLEPVTSVLETAAQTAMLCELLWMHDVTISGYIPSCMRLEAPPASVLRPLAVVGSEPVGIRRSQGPKWQCGSEFLQT